MNKVTGDGLNREELPFAPKKRAKSNKSVLFLIAEKSMFRVQMTSSSSKQEGAATFTMGFE